MSRPVVLIAEELSPATMAALGEGFQIDHVDGADRAALLAAVPAAEALLIRSATKVDAEVLDAAPRLRVVARAGVGLDNVDVKAATARGVMVVNAPTSNITSAAELAVGLLLAVLRRIVPANLSLRAGQWQRSRFTGVELAGKTVGIIGLGRIGVLVAQRLAGFGVTLIAYDPYIQPTRAAAHGVRMVTLEELLRTADVLTVHLPKTPETVGLLNAEALALVKPTAVLINAARGGIVDEAALYEALTTGRLAGAGLDVFTVEPCPDSPLFALDTVVATPHLGASTDEAQEKAGIAVAQSVRLALAGELVPDAVNVDGGVIAVDVRAYLPVTEHLGQIACALAPAAITHVEVGVAGEIAEHEVGVLALSALKGIFTGLVHDPVSYVNAPLLAAERGVTSELKVSREPADHRSVVRVRLDTTAGASVAVAATAPAPHGVARLVAVDEFDVDVPISAHLAFFRYHDRPGVVGMIGNILGRAAINIAGMQVARTAAGGEALVVLTVDEGIDAPTVAEITAAIGARFGRAVDL